MPEHCYLVLDAEQGSIVAFHNDTMASWMPLVCIGEKGKDNLLKCAQQLHAAVADAGLSKKFVLAKFNFGEVLETIELKA